MRRHLRDDLGHTERLLTHEAAGSARQGGRTHRCRGGRLRVARPVSTTETAQLGLVPATVRNRLSDAIDEGGGRNRLDAIGIARDASGL
jgi:hypothetical protein